MPTYDYLCRACGHALEVFQSITEGAKRKCPKCGKGRLERQIGAGAGFIFKGSGFYQTDYRSESYNQAAKADSAKPTEDKPVDKSADKPADKPADAKPEAGALPSAGKPASKPGPDKRSGKRKDQG